jgi:hypothetical protein
MKKLLISLLFSLLSVNAFAWGIPSVLNNDQDTTPLIKRSEAVKEKVGNATISMADGLSDVLDLAGKTNEASEIRSKSLAAKSDRGDFSKVESLSNAVGAGQKSLKGLVLVKAIPVAAAQAKLPSAIHNINTAVATDMSVSKETSALAQELPKAASSVKNPIQIKELSEATGAIKFVASQILPQAQTAATLSKELSAYAKVNHIQM